MAQPYVGEIRIFAGTFAPAGWHDCDGTLMPISENEILFQVIGTTYGGDGQQNFALPDLQSRVPIHMGNNFVIGQSGGVESVTLTVNQIPVHSHAPLATGSGSVLNPSQNAVFSTSSSSRSGTRVYAAPGTVVTLTDVSTVAGGSQPHENLQPYLAIRYIISLFGLFPTPT